MNVRSVVEVMVVEVMVVAVMKVGYVWVSVHDGLMPVGMLVSDHHLGVVVVVMTVIMHVFVIMLSSEVLVFVRVTAAQDESYANCGNRQCCKLTTTHWIRERRPSHDRTHEWSGRKNQLPAGSSQIAGTRDPESDRRAVPEPADQKCSQNRPTGGCSAERETDR